MGTSNLEELYTRLTLEEEGEEGFVVGEKDVNQVKNQYILVGKFLREKNINFNAMQNVLASSQTRSVQVQADRSWHKPPSGWVKINVDAAGTLGQGAIGVTCVARDDAGHFIRARTNVMRGSFQPRVAEALSLKEALSWTKEWRTRKCIFESHAKLLVEAVQGTRGTSYFDTIAENCSELLKHFDEMLLVFIYKSTNQVAHVLARAACSMSGFQEWISTAPDLIACNLAFDEI